MQQTALVRIGVWNLEGRWDERHRALLDAMRCDILLLTEVSERVAIEGMDLHRTLGEMVERRRWAAVASRKQLTAMEDPHGATAMVEIAGLRVCSSILPWRTCGTSDPWGGATTAEKTAAAVADVEAAAPTVWGGDWNHALSGREWSGSRAGRPFILDAVERLGLQIPTASAPHRINGLLSIDHIAIPSTWDVARFENHPAVHGGARISDDDAYVVETK